MTIMNHRVEQGEHLSQIAKKYGLADYRSLWDHPENAALKAKRQNPNILCPGDILFVKEQRTKEVVKPTDEAHQFVRRVSSLKLFLKLAVNYDEILTNARCTLIVEADAREKVTDEAAVISQIISETVEKAVLIVDYKVQTKNHECVLPLVIPILIGHLDPVEEVSGQRARLLNLGYYLQAATVHDELEFKSAVEEFQCDHGLIIDGICNAQTQAALIETHGC